MRKILLVVVLAGFLLWNILPEYLLAKGSWDYIFKLVDLVQGKKLPYMSTDDLFRMKAPEVMVIDVRTPEEFRISHIQNAVNLEKADEIEQFLKSHPADRKKIVLYCSVGYRSAVIGKTLKKKGFKNLYNLKGSIFKWANEDKPVYRNNVQVQTVHPYDKKWGKYLKKELWPGDF